MIPLSSTIISHWGHIPVRAVSRHSFGQSTIRQPFPIPTKRPNRNLVARTKSMESDVENDAPEGIVSSLPQVLRLVFARSYRDPPFMSFRSLWLQTRPICLSDGSG